MARIVYCHPNLTGYGYHVFTDLDFWDARRILKGLALVKRNFGKHVDGDAFPTQVVLANPSSHRMREIEKRLKRAIPSPPRHVVVRHMVLHGYFEFDPMKFYPSHWAKSRMMHFTHSRLPLQQSALSSPYRTVSLCWVGERIRIDRVQRPEKYDPVIRNAKEARDHLVAPSCF